ncbi:MAG: VOC family protein [Rhizobiales bacterium]|nr:VOC family protein [Hyphomicrobiales bacterium]
MPELLVRDLSRSLAFWRDILGFVIAYQRPEEFFVYLERAEGSQIMLCQMQGQWETAPLEPPFGRGAMFQLYVQDFDDLLARVTSSGWPLHHELREVWRRHGDRMGGQREFFVQDPDGYLLMIAQKIGERPLSAE